MRNEHVVYAPNPMGAAYRYAELYANPLHAHVLLPGFKDVYAKQIGGVLELCVQDTSDSYTVDHINRRHFDCDQSFMMQVIQTARLMTKEKHHA